MYSLLEKVLEDTQNVSVPWVISSSDLAPLSSLLVAPVPGRSSSSSSSSRPTTNRTTSSGSSSRDGDGGGRSPSRASSSSSGRNRFGNNAGEGGTQHSARGVPDLSRPTLKGASGPLPSELAERGRWFARTVGDGAVLLTFLPALDVWREKISARLEERQSARFREEKRKRRKNAQLSASSSFPAAAAAEAGAREQRESGRGQGEDQQPQQKEEEEKEKENVGKDEDAVDSLGLFLFLVRSGDFGLPIEPQSAELRGIRSILLAHIPLSHHLAMAFRPVRR